MHISTTEAALAGATISAVASAFGGLAIQRATKTRDHLTRIWERRAEVYEAVLIGVAKESHGRYVIMMMTRDPVSKPILFSRGVPDEIETLNNQELRARLIIYGTPRVITAYSQYILKAGEWLDSLERLEAKQIEPTEYISDDALAGIRRDHIKTREAEQDLVAGIQLDIRGIPKRTWRKYIFVLPADYPMTANEAKATWG